MTTTQLTDEQIDAQTQLTAQADQIAAVFADLAIFINDVGAAIEHWYGDVFSPFLQAMYRSDHEQRRAAKKRRATFFAHGKHAGRARRG